MRNNNGVPTGFGDRVDNRLTIPVEAQRLPVVGLFSPSLEHDNADFRLWCNPKISHITLCNESVVKPLLKEGAVFVGLPLQSVQWSVEVAQTSGTRASTDDQVSKFVVVLVVETLGWVTSIIAENSNRTRGLKEMLTRLL